MNNQLNEAFASSFVKEQWNDPKFKSVMEALRKSYKNLDINRLTDNDFVKTNAKAAIKLNKDVIKFWMSGKKLFLTTRSNSFFDSSLEVKKNRRGNLIGCNAVDVNKCMEQGNKYLENFGDCYILDVEEAIKNGANITKTQNERKLARTGAYALMTNRQIKQNNIKNYVQLLKDRHFSDGSEFALVQNINRILSDAIKNNGAVFTLISNIIDDTWVLGNIQAYMNILVDYINVLDRNGFVLPADAKPADFGIIFSKTDEEKLADIRSSLKKGIDKIKNDINSNSAYAKRMQSAVDSLLKHGKDEQEFKEFCTNTEKKSFIDIATYNQFVDIVSYINTEFPKVCNNPSISSDIMNFELFVTQLIGIREQLRNNEQFRRIREFLYAYKEFIDNPNRSSWVSDKDNYISKRDFTIGDGTFRRIQNYITMISKI